MIIEKGLTGIGQLHLQHQETTSVVPRLTFGVVKNARRLAQPDQMRCMRDLALLRCRIPHALPAAT